MVNDSHLKALATRKFLPLKRVELKEDGKGSTLPRGILVNQANG